MHDRRLFAAALLANALGALQFMRDRLEANLRPIVEAVLVEVPAGLQRFARMAAEGALRILGDGLTAANLAHTRRGFAAIVKERIPNEFRPLVEPYRDALNAAFGDALGTGLAFAFLLRAALAVVAVAVGLAGRPATWRGAVEEPAESR